MWICQLKVYVGIMYSNAVLLVYAWTKLFTVLWNPYIIVSDSLFCLLNQVFTAEWRANTDVKDPGYGVAKEGKGLIMITPW